MLGKKLKELISIHFPAADLCLHEATCRLGWALFVSAKENLLPSQPEVDQQFLVLLAVLFVLLSWAPAKDSLPRRTTASASVASLAAAHQVDAALLRDIMPHVRGSCESTMTQITAATANMQPNRATSSPLEAQLAAFAAAATTLEQEHMTRLSQKQQLSLPFAECGGKWVAWHSGVSTAITSQNTYVHEGDGGANVIAAPSAAPVDSKELSESALSTIILCCSWLRTTLACQSDSQVALVARSIDLIKGCPDGEQRLKQLEERVSGLLAVVFPTGQAAPLTGNATSVVAPPDLHAEAVAISRLLLAALLQGGTSHRITAVVVDAVLTSTEFHKALCALASEFVAASRQQERLSFAEVLRLTQAQAFDVSVLAGSLITTGLKLPLPLHQHLRRIHTALLEDLAWTKNSALFTRLLLSLPPTTIVPRSGADQGSPKKGRASIEPISRPDGGSPLTPRKRSRTGSFVGPIPLHIGREMAGASSSSSDNEMEREGTPPQQTCPSGFGADTPSEMASPVKRKRFTTAAAGDVSSPGLLSPIKRPRQIHTMINTEAPLSPLIIFDASCNGYQAQEQMHLPFSFTDDRRMNTSDDAQSATLIAVRKQLATFILQVVQLVAQRIAAVVVKINVSPITRIDFFQQAVNVAHWMAYHRTSVLYNSNIDTFAICAMFFVIKCLGVKEVHTRDLLRAAKQAAVSHGSRACARVPLQTAMFSPSYSTHLIASYNRVFLPASSWARTALAEGRLPNVAISAGLMQGVEFLPQKPRDARRVLPTATASLMASEADLGSDPATVHRVSASRHSARSGDQEIGQATGARSCGSSRTGGRKHSAHQTPQSDLPPPAPASADADTFLEIGVAKRSLSTHSKGESVWQLPQPDAHNDRSSLTTGPATRQRAAITNGLPVPHSMQHSSVLASPSKPTAPRIGSQRAQASTRAAARLEAAFQATATPGAFTRGV